LKRSKARLFFRTENWRDTAVQKTALCAAIGPSNVVAVFDFMPERIRCERIAESTEASLLRTMR
jgi:hypothetical protein